MTKRSDRPGAWSARASHALSTQARVAVADALVGARSLVERLAVAGPESRFARQFQHVGEGTAFSYPQARPLGGRWIRVGAHSLIGSRVTLTAGLFPDDGVAPETGWALRIGDHCLVAPDCTITSRIGIDIGDRVAIGRGAYLTDYNHAYQRPDVAVKDQWISEAPVVIGTGAWIGAGAIVLPGVTVGDNAVIGAGAVVTADVPARSVAVGSPARTVRRWDAAAGRWEPAFGPHQTDNAPPGWYDGVPVRGPSTGLPGAAG